MKKLYNYTGHFEEGLARVQLVQDWGYIDGRGNESIVVRFLKAGDFCEGKAAVKTERGSGFINSEGKFNAPLNGTYLIKEKALYTTRVKGF